MRVSSCGLALNIFKVVGSQIGKLRLLSAVGWQFVGWFDLEYTLELLQRVAVLYTCRYETLQMQSKCTEADGFPHGLAEAGVNQGRVINPFRLGQILICLTLWAQLHPNV